MKKTLLFFLLGVILTFSAKAQNNFTLNTRAWTTNYWTMLIYNAASGTIEYLLFDDPDDQRTFSRIVPNASLTFPVGIQKEVITANDFYSPYHHAFSNPFTKPGDFGAGLEASWKPGVFGIYAGAYFKSQEVCFIDKGDLRGFYFQPRAGLIMGRKNNLEAGVFYDMPVGAAGSIANVDKGMIASGWGLDFSLSRRIADKNILMVTFMLPLHNFFNEDYDGGIFKGLKRRVGYIMLTNRITF